MWLSKFHSDFGPIYLCCVPYYPWLWKHTFLFVFPWIFAVFFVSLLICFENFLYLISVQHKSCSKFLTNLSQETLCPLANNVLVNVVIISYSTLPSSFSEAIHFLFDKFFASVNWLIFSSHIFKYFLLFRLLIFPKLSYVTHYCLFCTFCVFRLFCIISHSFSTSLQFAFILY
jgi:hypothetical protein